MHVVSKAWILFKIKSSLTKKQLGGGGGWSEKVEMISMICGGSEEVVSKS